MDEHNSGGNGRARLTKEDLADPSRFQFKREVLDVSEDVKGVKLHLKTLSVEQTEGLPNLQNADGTPDMSTVKLAAVFAAVVEEVTIEDQSLGVLTADEAQAFLGGWPNAALVKVIEKFGDLTGTKQEQSAAAQSFPGNQ